MVKFVLNRLLAALAVLFVATLLVFLGVRALPGGPALALAGDNPTPEILAQINRQLGLDQPQPVQYWNYLVQLLSGDFGRSTATGVPVADLLALRVPVTLQFAFAAILVGTVIGISAGIISAAKKGTWLDNTVSVVSLIGLSIPHFWLGMLLILLFSINLGWVPASGFIPFTEDPLGWLKSIAMPAIALGVGLAAVLMRQSRSALLGQLGEDYIRTAKAKGLRGRTQVRHAARNSMTTVITVLGLQLGSLISGAVVIETVFVLPGFGKLMIDSINSRDYPVVQAAVIITVAAYVVINLLVDIMYALANPRVRVAGAGE